MVLLTIAETAQLLGVTTTTLRRWDKEGKLIPVKTLGGHRRYNKEEILKLLK